MLRSAQRIGVVPRTPDRAKRGRAVVGTNALLGRSGIFSHSDPHWIRVVARGCERQPGVEGKRFLGTSPSQLARAKAWWQVAMVRRHLMDLALAPGQGSPMCEERWRKACRNAAGGNGSQALPSEPRGSFSLPNVSAFCGKRQSEAEGRAWRLSAATPCWAVAAPSACRAAPRARARLRSPSRGTRSRS